MMDSWKFHLNPKYFELEDEESQGFRPYSKTSSIAERIQKPAALITKIHSDSKWLFIFFVLSLVALVQAILAVGSYSGEFSPHFVEMMRRTREGKPPIFGDFEAQRHWMEITYHLPVQKWYVNGTNNDLFYWGLDYPPLTAYHSYVMGFTLLKCTVFSFGSLLKVAIVVLVSFAVLWLPFILNGFQSVLAVLRRIFPFYRGLYERNIRLAGRHAFIISLFLRSTTKNLKLSLLISSLSFFLFSFQVHEKSILLVAIPAMLLLPEYPLAVVWLLHITSTSMFSLCLKDGTGILLALFAAYYFMTSLIVNVPGKLSFLFYHLSCISAIAVCIAEWTLTPPLRYPHIFPLLNAMFSCTHFLFFLAYFYFEMISSEYQVFAKKTS
ncbi:ALG6, ALG8 glycosyltransferase family protein [Necator americanus]|uniref:Alpha-1,3-glucosyltransferase n=1 Tax=Necator americanus TaxID=51031 RepID=W2T921_NECAM|nr:ALG6, ALG8 glycosyltransferase family protein [Necator americanus]ETN78510.1 ALG6, ALG8 glycosyltransferase family protein [Necator americanus]